MTIVTDPLKFNSTRESGDTTSNVYWGTNFMTINVDNSDQPVNIDIRPGSYNATSAFYRNSKISKRRLR